jgi:Ca2+-binding RTX toxin-like protein
MAIRSPSGLFIDVTGPEPITAAAPRPVPIINPHTNDPGLFFEGTTGDDTQNGTADDDGFDYSQGGNDTLNGLGGNDEFLFGKRFDKFDSVNGGLGYDILFLKGEYDAPVDPFLATTLTGVEEIRLHKGHFYRFGLNDGNVAAGETLTVDASELGLDDGFGFFSPNETDGSFILYGGKAGDGMQVGAGADVIDGNGGDDAVFLDISSFALKTLNGGRGSDTVVVDATGSGSATLVDTTMKNYQRILIQPDNDLGTINITITTSDGNVRAGELLEVTRQGISGTTVNLTFDGSAETDGRFDIDGSDGNDMLIGGAGADFLDSTFSSGNDQWFGNGGDDRIFGGGDFRAVDIANGGEGNDVLELRGDYSTGVNFDTATLSGIETITLINVGSYNLTLDEGNVGPGESLTIDGSGLSLSNVATLNAAFDSDGKITLLGGFNGDLLFGGGKTSTIHGNDGNDTLVGGSGRDFIFGGHGQDMLLGRDKGDVLDGGAAADWLELGTVGQSTGRNFDEIIGFDADNRDTIALFDVPVEDIDPTVVGGTLSNNDNFNDHLEAAIGNPELRRHHAVLFKPDDGNLAGTTFLIVDANGKAGYQANKDFVVLLTDAVHLGQLDASDFAVAA